MIMKFRRGAMLAAALGIVLIAMGGCAPDSGFNNVSDYDVVVTHYDPEIDFQKYATFAVADTLLEPGKPEDDDSSLPSGLKDLIVSEVETQMVRIGYVLESDPQSNAPDLIMVCSVTQTKWTGYVPGYPWYPGYGWGPWYPGYGGYYPGYSPGYTYSYDTGTVLVEMADYATLDPGSSTIDIVWTSGVNGVLSSSSSYNEERVQSGIDQAFTQSPYLKQNETP